MNELTKDNAMDQFKEKVQTKLREDIGDLLPDSALREMAARAIEEQFFQPQTVQDGYNRVVKKEPSWFVQEVAKVCEPMIRDWIKGYIEDNKDEIERAVKDFSEQANLFLLTTAAIRQNTYLDLEQLANGIVDRLKQGY